MAKLERVKEIVNGVLTGTDCVVFVSGNAEDENIVHVTVNKGDKELISATSDVKNHDTVGTTCDDTEEVFALYCKIADAIDNQY